MIVHSVRPAPDDALGMMQRARQRDPIGDRVHTGLVMAMLLLLPLGTAPLAIMTGIAIGYSLLRLWATGPAVGYLIRLPIVCVLLALLAWTLLSLTWSTNRPDGWDEASILRFQIPVLIALWPVIDRWRLLTWALAAGAAIAALVQIGQWVFGESWPLFFWWHAERIPGRFPGLDHPNSTAVVAATSILLLPRLMIEQRRQWPTLLALWVLAWVGLLLTGSRGAWLAVGAGVLASVPRGWRAWAALRRAHRTGRSWRSEWVIVGVLAAVALVFAVAVGPQVMMRVRDGVVQFRAAVEQGDYSGDVAARWRQFDISFTLARAHPLTGVGVGGYLDAARACVMAHPAPAPGEGESAQPPRRTTGLLTHPHSALLYHLALLGWPGLALYLAMWVLLAVEAARDRRRGVKLNRLPLVAGLFVAFLFDSHNMSAPGTIALIFAIAVIYYETRPDSRWRPSGDTAAQRPNNAKAATDTN